MIIVKMVRISVQIAKFLFVVPTHDGAIFIELE